MSSELANLDKQYVWHPFTPNNVWFDSQHQPLVIVEADGAILKDSHGKTYLDGNASIWTNTHGHRHPHLINALISQAQRLPHTSFLGTTNDQTILLAQRLAQSLNRPDLTRSFFSSDGSCSIEAGLKILFQYFQQNNQPQRTRFISLGGGYHGDTIGAMSLAHSETFHHPYKKIMFPSREVMSPYCYRCPFNQAKPERGADARSYRQCQMECMSQVNQAFDQIGEETCAMVMEPIVQGAAGMIMHPQGYLEKVSTLAQQHDIPLMLDEVMTGFGRTGTLFAFQKEQGVEPAVIALGKGISGGMLPLAVTVVEEKYFQGFSGGAERTFYHGHSYSGNALACSVALANLDVFEEENFWQHHAQRETWLRQASQIFWKHPNVGDVRQEGHILAVELVKDMATREPFDPALRLGHAVCQKAREYGLLTRPVGSVLVLMPPYCCTQTQIETMVHALYRALGETIV